MKRVMILAYYFPPIAASGSLRPLGLSRHLESHGYVPHVVSTLPEDAHPPVSQDPDLLERLPQGVRVDRLPNPNRLKQLLALRDRIRGCFKSKRSSTQETAITTAAMGSEQAAEAPGFLRTLKTAVLNRLFLFPDHQKPWIRAVVNHAQSLPEQDRPDIVFATGNPWSGLVAGMKVAEKLAIPFVADFRDPWTRNPKPAVSEEIHNLSCRLERKVLEAADLVLANTSSLRDQFVKDHPDLQHKFRVLTNGFDDTLLDVMAGFPGPDVSDRKELCHFGSVYELRKPDRLLEALTRLLDQGKLSSGDLRIRFQGHWGVEDPDCNHMADRLESAGLIVREPSLSHSDYLAAMKQSQSLLILQQDFPLQIPGKLYEYIAAGRPIVMVGGEGATSQLIQDHHLGYTVANDVAALSEFLASVAAGQAVLSTPDERALKKFCYSQLSGDLATMMDQIT